MINTGATSRLSILAVVLWSDRAALILQKGPTSSTKQPEFTFERYRDTRAGSYCQILIKNINHHSMNGGHTALHVAARREDLGCMAFLIEQAGGKAIAGPGQRILDIGCGWGGMALTLARDYGVELEVAIEAEDPPAESPLDPEVEEAAAPVVPSSEADPTTAVDDRAVQSAWRCCASRRRWCRRCSYRAACRSSRP